MTVQQQEYKEVNEMANFQMMQGRQTMQSLKITSGDDVKVKLSEIPDYKLDILARQTLHAVERFFSLPGIQEDYEKWLKEYKKKKEA